MVTVTTPNDPPPVAGRTTAATGEAPLPTKPSVKCTTDAKDDNGILHPFLSIHGRSIFFQDDWQVGIGGGLWSTGRALAQYFQTNHAQQWVLETLTQKQHNRKQRLRVLELGSGNGLLSACWLALASRQTLELVVTDTNDHLPLIRQTLAANHHLLHDDDDDHHHPGSKDWSGCTVVRVLEHRWGEFDASDDGWMTCDDPTFDVILGSDLAYRSDLYEPLIASLQHFSNVNTVVLLGATMVDTTPTFFRQLTPAGFEYRKLDDHWLPKEFHGTTFGLFTITRHVSSYPSRTRKD